MSRPGRSQGSESFIALPDLPSKDTANERSVREVVRNYEERISTINNTDRASVESSLKLVRDLITIIVSDESNLDKLENIIEKRVSRVSRGETGLSILSGQNRLPRNRSHSSVNEPVKGKTSEGGENEKSHDSENKENIQAARFAETADTGETAKTADTGETAETADTAETAETADTAETAETALRGETGLSILTGQNRLPRNRSHSRVNESVKGKTSEDSENEKSQDSENKENIQAARLAETADTAETAETAVIVISEIDEEDNTGIATQTSNAEVYKELAKRVAETRAGEMSTAELIAKVLPIQDSLKGISRILSDLVENIGGVETKDNNQEVHSDETTAVQPIKRHLAGTASKSDPKTNPENAPETGPENDINNLSYYVFYDGPEERRLQAWQKTLDAREKIAEQIIAQTGKRPAEILFNRMSTMELREKQMIQRLMDYADRMSPTQRSSKPGSRLRGYVNERNMPVREIQETVTRPRKRDIEISGVPNMMQQEMMAGVQNCPDTRNQWTNSDVLAQRIRERKRDLKRVVDYYPEISHLCVAGQRKQIQLMSYEEIQKRSREIAEKACANHFNSCFCNPQYGAGTSARKGDANDAEIRSQN